MQRIGLGIGKVIHYIGWPFWVWYFNTKPPRARVFVVCEGKLLLVQTWLGAGHWGTPGGGSEKGEDMLTAAIRELREETAIKATHHDIVDLGKYWHIDSGIKFEAYFYLLKLDKLPKVKVQKKEIAKHGWFSRAEVEQMDLSMDTRHGLDTFKQIKLL